MDKTSLIKGIEILDGTAKLRVSEDSMSVKVYPVTDGFELSMLKDMEQLLQEAGMPGAIPLTVPEQRNDHWIIARGAAPERGADGRIEILKEGLQSHRDLEQETGENSAGKGRKNNPAAETVDPRELNIIVNARRGDRIAKKIPPGRGKPGMDIFGREIPSVPGLWTAFHPGTGVKSVDNDTYLVATVSGKIHVEDGIISVFDEWEINGSVDISTGHINFYGRLLTIRGSVCGGFRVSVRGDLVIEGNVEDEATVNTRGDILVKGLVRARNTVITAGGKLRCSAVEYAAISAGSNIVVEDYLLDATCKAGGDVTINSGKGLIAGGRVLLGGSLTCRITGTAANVPTMIHAGFNPQIKEAHDRYVKDLEEYSGKRTELKRAFEKIDMLRRKHGTLPPETEALKNKIIKNLAIIEDAVAEKQRAVEEMEGQIGRLRSATIKIHQKAYPNSIIRIANASLVLKKEVEAVLFRFRKGQVVLSVI